MSTPPSSQDTLYATQQAPGAFCFDERVARVFPDMILRSVPGYLTLVSGCGVIAAQYAQTGSHCYDLGCSLGAVTWAMDQSITQSNCQLVAVDNSAAMIRRCQSQLATTPTRHDIHFVCQDITDLVLAPASVIVLNFTLQFIAVEARHALLSRLYQALLPGGVLVLAEKVHAPDPTQEQTLVTLHHAFKRHNGYSDLEISQKRAALENVLVTESAATHTQRLTEIGFQQVQQWYQCFNFISLIAVK